MNKYYKLLIFLLFSLQFSNEVIINLTSYNYPKNRGLLKNTHYQIAIMGTNDLHGRIFGQKTVNIATQQKYEAGGLLYLASYIKTLRKEWGKRFLWFDAGDQFQGSLESKLSKGAAIINFFNLAGLNAATFGNHEFDFGIDYLKERTTQSKFNYVVSNIYDKTLNSYESFPNQVKSAIVNAGEIKVGIIGITTIETVYKIKTDVSNYDFKLYKDIIVQTAKTLRKKGAQLIILISHAGLICKNINSNDLILQMWNQKNANIKTCNPNGGEIPGLLDILPSNTIDAIIAGHEHTVNHFFYKNIPIISSTQYGEYTHVIYFSFDKKTFEYLPKETVIEGPLPICGKIYSNTKKCNVMIDKTEAAEAGELSEFFFHGTKIIKDENTSSALSQLKKEVDKLTEETLVETDVHMMMDRSKENFLGNFIADTLKDITNADIVIINKAIFRKSWEQGKISVVDFFTMFPIENVIIKINMTGAEVKRLIEDIETKGGKWFYQMSGVTRTYKIINEHPIITKIAVFNGQPLIDDKIYSVASCDYLIQFYGDDFKNIKSWFTPRNLKTYDVMVDMLISHFRSFKQIKIIKEKDYVNPKTPRLIKED